MSDKVRLTLVAECSAIGCLVTVREFARLGVCVSQLGPPGDVLWHWTLTFLELRLNTLCAELVEQGLAFPRAKAKEVALAERIARYGYEFDLSTERDSL